MRRDFTEYHKSISQELKATQNRVRNLIGDAHWQTDGEHKEAVLRKIIKSHVPESLRVGKGFICYPNETDNHREDTSTQLDILLTEISKPTLFKDGDLTIVTPDAVQAIIEVKTQLHTPRCLTEALTKLSDQVQKVRLSTHSRYSNSDSPYNIQKRCWAGLFVYDSELDYDEIMQAVTAATNGQPNRVINCIALGEDTFIRYWYRRTYADGNEYKRRWHLYHMPGLAFGYFISNVVSRISSGIPENVQLAWFPIPDGKESVRTHFADLNGYVGRFP